MTIEIALLISIISVSFSVYFGFKSSKRTDTTDVAKRVAENTEICVKLDLITSTTYEIKNELSSMREDIKGIDKRLVICEQSVKSAHHRLDGFEDRLNAGKEGIGHE